MKILKPSNPLNHSLSPLTINGCRLEIFQSEIYFSEKRREDKTLFPGIIYIWESETFLSRPHSAMARSCQAWAGSLLTSCRTSCSRMRDGVGEVGSQQCWTRPLRPRSSRTARRQQAVTWWWETASSPSQLRSSSSGLIQGWRERMRAQLLLQ